MMVPGSELDQRIQALERVLGLPVESVTDVESLVTILERMVEQMGNLEQKIAWLTDRAVERG